MARILCITDGRMAMFNATTALASRLEKAGHSIVMASPDKIGDRVEARQLRFVQLPDSRFPDRADLEARGVGSAEGRRQKALRQLGVGELARTVQEIDPGLILIDIELHAHIVSILPLGIPIGLLCTFLTIDKQPGLPPLHSKIVPGRGWRGSWPYAEWLWARFRIRKALQRWVARFRLAGLDRISLLRSLAQQGGVEFSKEVTTSQWLIPVSYRRLPVVCLRAGELNFRPEGSPGSHFCGPMVEPDRQDTVVTVETTSRLDELYRRRREGKTDALILCSLSSFAEAEPDFVRRVAQSVADEPRWELILALGGSSLRESLDEVPDNVHLFDWVPQMRVLDNVDCALINAGSSSVTECIYQGVPAVVFSLQRNDQNGNAARVVYHGLGIAGDAESDGAEAIRSHIRVALSDQGMRDRVARMQRLFAAYDAEQRAVQVVEGLIDPHRAQ
jgi:UDP:flavonoid glycosyltransferase YjiC (YdhE family)